MLRVLLVCCVIAISYGQTGLSQTTNVVESNETFAVVNELVTYPNTDVSEAELATSTTRNAEVLGLNPLSSGDLVSSDRQCPRGSSKPCVVKCCPLGQSVGNKKVCEPTSLKFQMYFSDQYNASNSTADEDEYDYVFGNPCRFGRYRLEPHSDSNDEFEVLSNGSLRALRLFPYPLEPHQYCLDVFCDSVLKEEKVLPLICFAGPSAKNSVSIQYILYPIGLLISVPFLVFTMLVYCLIPELRDLHGKSLACHVLCLYVAYILLVAVQLGGETLNQKLCVSVAFMIHFSFVACFLWLNVLCVNTWWNVLANMKLQKHSEDLSQNQYMCYKLKRNGEVRMPKQTECKVFIFYSLYAWGLSVIITAASMVMDFMPTIPSSYLKPNFGDNKCWFSSEEAELQYFYVPMGILICLNILLFILTARNLYNHEWKKPRCKLRQVFRMCLTLFGMMGINWVMEFVSWAAGGPDYIWYVTDVINTLQGVIIFCIFVLEPRVRECVKKNWGHKFSEILCRRWTPSSHASVNYSTPEDAAVKTGIL